VAINKPVLSSSLWKGCDKMRGGEEGLLNEARTNCVSQALTGHIKQLADRYATLLPLLTADITALTTHGGKHPRKMDCVWN